jgi:hypothetical protein
MSASISLSKRILLPNSNAFVGPAIIHAAFRPDRWAANAILAGIKFVAAHLSGLEVDPFVPNFTILTFGGKGSILI